MEVILLEKIRNLGTLGAKVKVKPGFARNYLIPQGKAVYATVENLTQFEKRRAEFEKRATEKHKEALTKQEAIQALGMISIAAKVGDEGKLFGSVTARDISDAFAKAGVSIERRDIRLPEGALRMVGEYEIAIDLESNLSAQVKINIVGEG